MFLASTIITNLMVIFAIMEFLHPNAMIEFYGTPVIPYAGTYRGHDECRRFFERAPQEAMRPGKSAAEPARQTWPKGSTA